MRHFFLLHLNCSLTHGDERELFGFKPAKEREGKVFLEARFLFSDLKGL